MTSRAHRGSALITALISTMMVFITGAGLLTLSMQGARRGRFDVLRSRALALAEAGVERALFYLRTTAPDGTTDGSWRTANQTETYSDHGDYTVSVVDGTGDNLGKILITCTGRATDGPAAKVSTYTSAASYGPLTARRTLRVAMTLDRQEISIWNNAIFGGVGQAGKSINGNVRIRGSVHLLGDGEAYTDVDQDNRWDAGEAYTDANHNSTHDLGESYADADGDGHYDAREPFEDVNGNGNREPALTVTDLSSEFGGDANIGNNYEGMPFDLLALIPDLDPSAFRGETVDSLDAKLRVKHGRVALSGSATVGEPNAAGWPYLKETMDGAFVNDGFTGNAGASHVYSDNGTKADYNLGDILRFPTLTERTTKGGITFNSYMDYLKTQGMTIQGSITLKPGEAYGPVSDGRGNSLSVDGGGNVSINGIVYVEGDISFAKNGGNKDMRYSGRGTLVSTNNISVETNLVPVSTFPTIHAMGFIARRDMALGTSSQLKLAGAFYAQETISSTKQNELLGTFVTSYFMMQNVPHMYQVPTLVDNLPPGMPGSERIWVKSIRVDSWRDVNQT
jgi:hypothetical protein